MEIPHKGNNTLFMGSEGMLVCGFGQRKLLPEEKFKDFRPPEKTIEKSPGFHVEWVDACRGGRAATCNFEYSGPLAESVMLANVAYRSKSYFEWDAKNLKSSESEAQKYIRESYSKGWQVK